MAAPATHPLTHRLRVRYSECDQQNVVFNGHYLFYFDIAYTEFIRATHGSYQGLLETGFDAVVAESTVRFRSPAHFDEDLDLNLWVAHLGTTSMAIEATITHGERLVAEIDTRYVFVDPATAEKKPMSDDLRGRLAAYRKL
jgi:acyl-CoA thioester hydrolase